MKCLVWLMSPGLIWPVATTNGVNENGRKIWTDRVAEAIELSYSCAAICMGMLTFKTYK